MYKFGSVEKKIYSLRNEHPLILPQIDPDKYTTKTANNWFKRIEELNLQVIVIGSSIISNKLHLQNLMNIAVNDFKFDVLFYINGMAGIKGIDGKSAVYWSQIPNSLNTFFGWDGLISNSLNLSKSNFEPIPTIYVFDFRGSIGTSNWLTRSNPVPREKPEISLAIAKAAEYSGIRFYIMAGGSGSNLPPPETHIKKISKLSNLFLIPTSGITTLKHAKSMFSSGADAIHIGNLLEKEKGFKILNEIVKISKNYSGKDFL